MIYCTTQARDKYVHNYNGIVVGPWAKYRENPAVFSILSFMSPLLYQWELGSPVPVLERLTGPEASVEKQLKKTLCQPLDGGKSFSGMLLTAKDPKDVRDMLFRALDKDKGYLPIYATYSEEQLRLIVDARVSTWAKTMSPSAAIIAWASTKSEAERIVKENAYGKYIKIHQ